MAVVKFPAMKPAVLKRLLCVKLGYKEVTTAGKGSHTQLRCEGRPTLTWGWNHTSREISAIEVRNTLVKVIGLTMEQAWEVLK